MSDSNHTLVLGWGNPGRLDDGLGPAFTEKLEQASPPGVTIGTDYQLTMEDAAEVARYRRVLFVDADRTGPAPFRIGRLYPSRNGSSFSTHSLRPEAVLALSRDLFDGEPEAWLLGIRGYDFDAFGEELTATARENLARAVAFTLSSLEIGSLHEVRG